MHKVSSAPVADIEKARSNQAERRRLKEDPSKGRSATQIAEEFPRLEGETFLQWEERFVQQLSHLDLKRMFVQQTKELRDTGSRLGVLKKELKARGIK